MTAAPVAVAARPTPMALWRKAALAGEILMLYSRVRPCIRANDVRRAVEEVRPAGQSLDAEANGAAHAAGLRYGRAVVKVLTALPLDSRCLMQSVVLCGVLARRGLASTVVIGVRPGAEFGAHAWVEMDGKPLLPPQEDEFERLLAL